MKAVFDVVYREIKNQKIRFVFPSQTAAALWARKSCEFCGERSAALNRFIAWDSFKETAIRSKIQDREPVSGVLRKLFTEALVQKNARAAAGVKKSPPFPFQALIPAEFAEQGSVFSGELAKLLPSLALLRNRQGAAWQRDDEDRDFAVLEEEYRAFLEKHKLFEPSWEKPPLGDRDHEYYIFFPAAIEDYEEYRDLLDKEPSIHTVDDNPGEAAEPLRLYHSSRAEIRDTALEIRRLSEEEKIPYEDMAVSVPDLENMESYILRDFTLYDIPVRRRAGKPLAEYGAGRLFTLAGACMSNNFSFDSLKALLLDEQIPWRRPDLNRALIEFGVTNNCVSGYWEQGRFTDVWAEALGRMGREETLHGYYGELKKRITALAEVKDFAGIRRSYFAFRGRLWEKSSGEDLEEEARVQARIREAYPEAEHPGSVFQGFLSPDACSDEADAVLARCIEELSALIRLEENYPDLIPASPFNFLLERLREVQYVPVRTGESGVNLFPYRVAAAAPFAAHFVLGASQQNATVLYQPLKFLRQDKRKKLGLSDYDASAVFFRLYRTGSFETAGGTFRGRTMISAAERTFSGWAIPHSRFPMRFVPPEVSRTDPFQTERGWWARNGAFPRQLFSVQKKGFEQWYALLRQPEGGGAEKLAKYNFLTRPFSAAGPVRHILDEHITRLRRETLEGSAPEGAQKNLLKVSATDLNKFFFCPVFWLFDGVFCLENQDLEARLLDDASLGNLYHEILKNLFTKIRTEDRCFLPEHLETYRRWAEDCTREAARNFPAFQGPLAVPLLSSMARTMTRKIRALLDMEAKNFPGFAVSELEGSLEMPKGGLLFKGRLDRVSVSPDEAPFIMDYKTTAAPPSKAKSSVQNDNTIEDFQIPMYVKLYEEKTGIKIGGALFISINGGSITAVVGKPGGTRGHSREEYQPTLEALENYIVHFASSINELDFVPREIPLKNCTVCAYKTVCRRAYSLNNQREEAPHAG